MEDRAKKHPYDDIIHLSRPVSGRHAPMSMVDRGAQFSPFAALVGYEAVLQESARLTEAETFLEEDGKEELSRALRYLADHLEETGEIKLLVFQPDDRKSGGKQVWCTGRVKKIDLYSSMILMESGEKLPLEHIRAIEGLEWEQL